MLKRILVNIGLFLMCTLVCAQDDFNLPNNKDYTKINFKLINNLIVFPVEVNGVELSFLLDSGVSKPILFNIINLTDSLLVNNVERIYLRGLGADGEIEALRSRENFLKVGDAININQDIYVVFDNSINFTPRLGVDVHGIIGYDIFKDFVVEINYRSKFIKLFKHSESKYKNCRKCESFDMILNKNKPYIDAYAEIDTIKTPVKLLIDTGSSDALWLFEDHEKQILPPNEKYFHDFLGKGLSGNIHGKRSRVNSFSLGDFHLENVNVAYPDSASISHARKFEERNGSISGDLLKRFNIVVDYKNLKVTLKKNSNFRKPFFYNKSGIVLEQYGVRVIKELGEKKYIDNYGRENRDNIIVDFSQTFHYSLKPSYTIVELREGSPAERAGLEIGDVILSINNKGTHKMTLQEATLYFCEEDKKLIKLEVERKGIIKTFTFRLESLL